MTADGIEIVIAIVFSVCGSAAFIACYFDSFLNRINKKPAPKNEADEGGAKT